MIGHIARTLLFALAFSSAATAPTLAAPETPAARGPLHVPSPDWRDQIIYFLLTDRFADGDPHNNDQGGGEFDPAQRNRYSGGDLAGVRQRLDYIQGLGATAVWITPPVENAWFDPQVNYGGYHGYWARHFKRMDPHVGTLDDYRALSRALHGRAMFLVQDIVLNHTGNFFSYDRLPPADNPGQGRSGNPGSAPGANPTQWPFTLNDPHRSEDAKAAIYHWTPTIADLSNRNQELTWQLSGLDDLNTTNPIVRKALRDAYGFWLREAGVDAFRIDTAFYVEPDLIADFIHNTDAQAPGMNAVARATGRKDLLVFGEGFGIDRPFEDHKARKLDAYMTGPRGETIAPGMINFPLYGAMSDVFARGRAPAELAWRIESMMKLHKRPHLMPTFLDNHDVDRFLAGGSVDGYKQGLLLMMTLPGIPVLYYGSEQGFKEQRAAMFAKGWGAQGRDWFDTNAALYRYTAATVKLRRDNRVFSRGTPRILYAAAAGPGGLAYLMSNGEANALVVVNNADRPILLANVATGLAPGAALLNIFAIDGTAPDVKIDAKGSFSVTVPSRSGFVWKGGGSTAPAAAEPQSRLSIDAIPTTVSGAEVSLSGSATPSAQVRVVLDGDVNAARAVRADARGQWRAPVDIASLVDPDIAHSVVALAPETGGISETRTFRVSPRWALAADVSDAAGDDTGPAGANYTYPTHSSFAPRTMDIRRVRAFTAGGALRLEITMNDLSQIWSPQNGFDHLSLTAFVEIPGARGASWMPLQNAQLPNGITWRYRLRVHGWSNAMFANTNASKTEEGAAISPAAKISVDAPARKIMLDLPAASLGSRASLDGVRIYLTTWDYDGGYRALEPEAGPFSFGGGAPDQPKWIDAVGPITLRAGQ
jgi:glycosidase